MLHWFMDPAFSLDRSSARLVRRSYRDDHARYVDEQGLTNHIVAMYWIDPADHETWRDRRQNLCSLHPLRFLAAVARRSSGGAISLTRSRRWGLFGSGSRIISRGWSRTVHA
jgi:hypothetical protein